MNGNDGSCNILRVVDNFIDTRYTLRDVHTGNTGKVESLQGHLSGRLTNTLGSNGTNGLARLHNALVHFLDVYLEEVVELVVSDTVETVL